MQNKYTQIKSKRALNQIQKSPKSIQYIKEQIKTKRALNQIQKSPKSNPKEP